MSNLDEAYLEFLSMYDSGHITEIESLNSLMEHEKLLRPTSDVRQLSPLRKVYSFSLLDVVFLD